MGVALGKLGLLPVYTGDFSLPGFARTLGGFAVMSTIRPSLRAQRNSARGVISEGVQYWGYRKPNGRIPPYFVAGSHVPRIPSINR